MPRKLGPSKSKVDKIEELKVFLYHLVTISARNTLKTKDCIPSVKRMASAWGYSHWCKRDLSLLNMFRGV